jgi:hypothetical protein
MNPQSGNVNELITMARRVSEKKRAEVGIVMPALNPANVPPAIRPLLQHAEILGIGDDGTRDEIFEAVPSEYLGIVEDAIAESPELFDWYRESETTDAKHSPEVAAIGWMLFGLNLS